MSDGLIDVDTVEDQSAPRCFRCGDPLLPGVNMRDLLPGEGMGPRFCQLCLEDIWESAESHGDYGKHTRVNEKMNYFRARRHLNREQDMEGAKRLAQPDVEPLPTRPDEP